MSYLSPLRLHFAGRFQANVSTVNNDPGHFDNDAFRAAYQAMETATTPNGWFNPQGDAAFRLGEIATGSWDIQRRVAAPYQAHRNFRIEVKAPCPCGLLHHRAQWFGRVNAEPEKAVPDV